MRVTLQEKIAKAAPETWLAGRDARIESLDDDEFAVLVADDNGYGEDYRMVVSKSEAEELIGMGIARDARD